MCVVESIGALDPMGLLDDDKIYYTLSPCYAKGSQIFTPIDNDKVKMRLVMTRQEAMQLIDDIKDIEALWIADERRRELDYRGAFQKCDCRELVKIIKTIYLRKQSRLAKGKKVTSGDEKYFRMAEESLYGELAISLGMDKEGAKEFVIARVEELTEEEQETKEEV